LQHVYIADAHSGPSRSNLGKITGETFVWNRRDNSGAAVPVGFYIYKIGTSKEGAIAGPMVLVR
jgi:hypothetical protein